MKTKTSDPKNIRQKVTLTLPGEIVENLNKIATFNNTRFEDLVYSYIADGIAGDSRTVRRMHFTDNANKILEKNNIPPKTVDDIFNNLVY
jgi:hypothetical protein